MGLYRFLLTLVVVTLLVSCGSAPKRNETPTVVKQHQPTLESSPSQQDYFKQAEEIFAQTGDLYQRNVLLVKAADALQQQGDCNKSLKVLQVLQPELHDKEQLNIANLLSAECLVSLSTPEANEQAQLLIKKINLVKGYEQRLYKLQAQIYSQQRDWVNASAALLLSNTEEVAKSQQIWQWLQHLSSKELEQTQQRQPRLQPWLQLSLIVRTYGLQPELFIQHVASWQSRFSQHALATHLPSEISKALQQSPIQAHKIAVLLPLSGRLASQGLALKQGILAAYLSNLPAAILPTDNHANVTNYSSQSDQSQPQYRQLDFIDSALKTPQELNAAVVNYDFVLGPLLKENISGLTDILPKDKIMLALNRTDTDDKTATNLSDNNDATNPVTLGERYFYALAPEDEAQQLATQIKQQGFKRPIIFAADNSVTSRMTDAFVATWLAGSTPMQQPDVAVFSDSKDMRTQVESLLDVAQSKARIRQMENVANIEVYGVERNRQDIDVIVLFASPQQTELLNPIIEASLSPFANNRLAVYASSRSYSLELSKNSLRDLRNLTFSDMPWMLPGNPWQQLAEQSNELWPQRQDSLLRLFAMGYDAYDLIANLRQLKNLPQLSKDGLTGELNVDANGILHRHLPLAKVLQDRVSVLAVD